MEFNSRIPLPSFSYKNPNSVSKNYDKSKTPGNVSLPPINQAYFFDPWRPDSEKNKSDIFKIEGRFLESIIPSTKKTKKRKKIKKKYNSFESNPQTQKDVNSELDKTKTVYKRRLIKSQSQSNIPLYEIKIQSSGYHRDINFTTKLDCTFVINDLELDKAPKKLQPLLREKTYRVIEPKYIKGPEDDKKFRKNSHNDNQTKKVGSADSDNSFTKSVFGSPLKLPKIYDDYKDRNGNNNTLNNTNRRSAVLKDFGYFFINKSQEL